MSLRGVVRECIDHLNAGDLADVPGAIRKLKEAGAVRDIHVGRKDMKEGSDETCAWYAGQILAVLEDEHWFCVNSLINCVDRFAPEKPGE